jgi:hypothetical protein
MRTSSYIPLPMSTLSTTQETFVRLKILKELRMNKNKLEVP